MRIILANYRYYFSGGPESYMFAVKAALEERGHEVIPFSVRSDLNEPTAYSSFFPHGKSDKGDAYFGNVKKTPRNVALLLSSSFYNGEAYLNLRALIREARPDAVYVLQQINALSPSVFKACADEGVRVVHRLSDFNLMCPRSDFLRSGEICVECLTGRRRKALACKCCHGSGATTLVRVASMSFHERMGLFDNIDAFVTPTEFSAELLSLSGVERNRIVVVPTFAGVERAAWHADEGYLLYLGRLSSEKGVEYAIRALTSAPSARLKVAGKPEGTYYDSLRVLVRELGLEERVEFIGLVAGEAKLAAVDGARALVCPSVWFENMPNVILEANARSKPVVVFDVGCMRELVLESMTGLVTPLGDVRELGVAMERIATDDYLARRLGEAAHERCARQYSTERHIEALLRVLAPEGQQKSAKA